MPEHHRKLSVSFTGGLFTYIMIRFQLAGKKDWFFERDPRELFNLERPAGKLSQRVKCELFW